MAEPSGLRRPVFEMAFVAFPLRLEKNFLAKCDEAEAVMQLLRVIARTPHGSWKGSKHFGVRDLFEGARTARDLPELARREINLAFEDLGITRYRVAEITAETTPHQETQSYVVTRAATDDSGETVRVGF